MLAYGYEWGSEADRPLALQETSLECSREELDELIAMLQDFRARIPVMEEGDHQHFRDWSGAWAKDQSDFILLISNTSRTKENHR